MWSWSDSIGDGAEAKSSAPKKFAWAGNPTRADRCFRSCVNCWAELRGLTSKCTGSFVCNSLTEDHCQGSVARELFTAGFKQLRLQGHPLQCSEHWLAWMPVVAPTVDLSVVTYCDSGIVPVCCLHAAVHVSSSVMPFVCCRLSTPTLKGLEHADMATWATLEPCRRTGRRGGKGVQGSRWALDKGPHATRCECSMGTQLLLLQLAC